MGKVISELVYGGDPIGSLFVKSQRRKGERSGTSMTKERSTDQMTSTERRKKGSRCVLCRKFGSRRFHRQSPQMQV
jgi:hypothetical protein